MIMQVNAETGLRNLLLGHLVPMVGAALLGAMFDWLLSLNVSNAPQLLHGGLWILILGMLGVYYDYKKGLARAKYWERAPEMFVVFALLLMNLSLAFWIIMILAGLGLGFDMSVVHLGLKWILGFISFMSIFLIGMELDNHNERS